MRTDDSSREGQGFDPDVDASSRMQPSPKRSRALLAVGAMALVGLTIGGVALFESNRDPQVVADQPPSKTTLVEPSTTAATLTPDTTSVEEPTTTKPTPTTPAHTTPSTPPQPVDWKSYIGRENPSAPAWVIDQGGGLFTSNLDDPSPYSYRYWHAGEVEVLLIKRGPLVVDTLVTPLVGLQQLSTDFCVIDGVPDPYLITTLDFGDEDGILTPSGAWRFDPATEKVMEIDPANISCVLPAP